MSLTGEEIRANLTKFAARWGSGDWGERQEAQTFLNELFDAYGMDRRGVAEFERFESGGFYDLIWPGVCLIEMKGTGEAGRLSKHRVQALQYWRDAANESKGIPAPRYVVLCAFRRFEIWQPGEFPAGPRVAYDLAELPDRFEVLGFLVGEEPLFDTNRAAVTIEAASRLADLNASLDERGEGGPDDRRLFILQCVWCMFAEDMGQIQGQRFTKIIDSLISHPSRSSADDLGALFQYLNDPSPQRPDHGLYKDVPYADGKLFEQPRGSTSRSTSSSCFGKPADRTGTRSSRRYSDRFSKECSAGRSSGSLAPTTPTSPRFRRSSCRRSSSLGWSESRTSSR